MSENVEWTKEDSKILRKWGFLIIIGLLIIYITANGVTTISAGERGVLMEFGKVNEGTILSPGWHFIIPIYNSVAKMNVQTQVYESEAMAASKDLQNAKTKIALNYHISPHSVNLLYRDIGIDYQTKVIVPAIQEEVKSATAKFNADELITKRQSVKDAIQIGLYQRLSELGVIVEQISITNFEFSPEFSAAIEQKVTAQQLAFKAENDLTRITIEAKQKVAIAEGDKQATILSAEGKAREIEIIQKQLSMSPTYINYLATRQWDGRLPMVTGGGMPLVQIPQQTTSK